MKGFFADLDIWLIAYGMAMYGIGRIVQYLFDIREMR